MLDEKYISIRGAKEHNLKNIDIDIPRDKFVVVTGLSGSGKSSLAFDTIYAEGQRRYVESLSSYARQFLEQMQKPDVEHIEGLQPTISIEQRGGSANPRSTVATTTEIYDYLRLLYARVGAAYCYKCGREISQQTPQQIVEQIMRMPEGSRFMVLAPMIRGRKGEHRDVFDRIRRDGFVRARVDGVVVDVSEIAGLAKNKKHEIEVVIDRLVIKKGIRSRLNDSVETALKLGEGIIIVTVQSPKGLEEQGGFAERMRKGTDEQWQDYSFSELYACPHCGISFGELSPRMFSFNSPYGACPECDGLGTRIEFDPDLIVPDKTLSLSEGAIEACRKSRTGWIVRRFARRFGVRLTTPFNKIDKELRDILMNGATRQQARKYGASFVGVIPYLTDRFQNTEKDYVKQLLHSYMSELPCNACKGKRLRPESLAVKVGGVPIHEVTAMSIKDAHEFFSNLDLSEEKTVIAHQILKEIRSRLKFMIDVGIGYLTLDRKSGTLAGGEAQRIRLATQIGSGLVGVCYVLDEPSIGLHQRDNRRLIGSLLQLRDLGNTVIVVEHDEETIRNADHVIDLGPGAGEHGGEVVARGSLDDVTNSAESMTGRYLNRELKIEVPAKRREMSPRRAIEVRGARENNLKSIDVRIPLGVFCCVTGVSGSGKSTLVSQILHKALVRKLHGGKEKPGAHKSIVGAQRIDKVIEIDQSPIGRTPRSNPATYTNAFTPIRELFTHVREARIRGYKPGRFSFNVKGGRCEACEGQGTKKIEMHFLPDIFVKCEECKGKRYNKETLEIRFKGANISDVLDMSVEEALEFFANHPKIKRILQTLNDVGLGYIKLGQSSTTLSGGEAQRVKLSTELGKVETGNTFYILDEPTTGLHFDDIRKLLDVLNRLVDRGNTVLVIEHNLDVIKTADWIIDLGPEGGDDGGEIVAQGTPEDIAMNDRSYTGQHLRKHLSETETITLHEDKAAKDRAEERIPA